MQDQQSVLEPNPPSATTTLTPPARPRAPKTIVHSNYTLPSDRVPFSVHFEILSRFVTHSRNGQEAIAAERIEGGGVPKQAAQMNVKFLTSVGLLKFVSKGLYLPSQESIRFVNAKTVGDDRARPILREIVQPTWFAEIVTSVLRLRPVVTEEALIGELAMAAETNKERKGPALQVLVEYLLWSGILVKDEQGLRLADAAVAPSTSASGTAAPAAQEVLPATTPHKVPGTSPPTSTEVGSWHIVQTEDYFLKVRSDLAVVQEVEDQLTLLTKKIQRLRSTAAVDAVAVNQGSA